eukprot:gb/GEZN01010884.1/.p1 GENE.gb/GEZN01010884.1/~~gb/GEZN01010884.1/.p1  ORF type:complete len:350 (+),score=43.31 gb/GEZN01010884.1/:110-1159(+)
MTTKRKQASQHKASRPGDKRPVLRQKPNSQSPPGRATKIGLFVVVVLAFSWFLIARPATEKQNETTTVPPSSKRLFFSDQAKLPNSTASFSLRPCQEYAVKQPLCSPPPSCGRYVHPNFLTSEEVLQLKELAVQAMEYGGGAGPVTIFDVPSGALSYGEQFISLYGMLKSQLEDKSNEHATTEQNEPKISLDVSLVEVYLRVADKAKKTVMERFNVSSEMLGLTTPSFFSRISGDVPARTLHDEYWHEHVDTEQYGSFAFTALLYLSEGQTDFEGGEFVFGASENTPEVQVDPSPGTFLAFTSGPENPHWVQQVTHGVRYALTIAFSCDPKTHAQGALASVLDTLRQQH